MTCRKHTLVFAAVLATGLVSLAVAHAAEPYDETMGTHGGCAEPNPFVISAADTKAERAAIIQALWCEPADLPIVGRPNYEDADDAEDKR